MLTDQQKENAVELFAQGVSRIQIAQRFIDEPTDDIQAVIDAHGEIHAKEKIADALRPCDPASGKFAISKYEALYQQHLVAFRAAMEKHYDQMIAAQIKEGHSISKDIKELIDDVRHAVDNARESMPTGNSEWNNTMRTLISLYKAQIEHNAKTADFIKAFANPPE